MSRKPERFERPPLERAGPKRSASTLYRSASDDGRAAGGIPLDSVEAGVVAAVRMGYKIAEAQIDRSARLATRLKQAGDQAAGPASERQALDATEQLIFRAFMGGLSWLEGLAADGHPLKKLVSAEYRILGSLLGLTTANSEAAGGSAVDPSGDDAHRASAEREAVRASPPASAMRTPAADLQVRHDGAARRAVRVLTWQMRGTPDPRDYPLDFYSADHGDAVLKGRLILSDPEAALLRLSASAGTAVGMWTAAICDDDGLQRGDIQIEVR